MSSLNQNYATAITGWRSIEGAEQVYTAGAAHPFNTPHPAAYVLFWISGDIQAAGAAFETRQFLWGNLDDVDGAGWGLMLEPDGAEQLTLMARVYTALGPRDVSVLISNPAAGAYIDRLILAELYYDGARLSLSVNGSLSGVDDVNAAALYAPSALPPSLGGEADGTSPALNCAIVAAGFTAGGDAVTASTIGRLAGAHFKACRTAADGIAVAVPPDLAWLHAYTAARNSGESGRITKTAAGASLVTAPTAPATLADSGTAELAWPLTRSGAGTLGVAQESQPIWYSAPAFSFAVGGGGGGENLAADGGLDLLLTDDEGSGSEQIITD